MMEAEGEVKLLEGDHKPRNEGKLLESGKGKGWMLPWSFQKKCLLTHRF